MPTSPPVAAFVEALASRRFFEAHEILEAYWVDYRGSDREFYKGLIQAAVALHHESTGNLAGARAVARRAGTRLAAFAPSYAGVDVAALVGRLARVTA